MYARLLLLGLLLIDGLSGNNELINSEVCNTDNFKAECGMDEVIIIEEARYGRYQIGICVTEDFAYVGCVHDVMMEAEMACSGRRSCSMRVNDVTFNRATPCHKELKNHLWISYRCHAVFNPSKNCREGEKTLVNLPFSPVVKSQQHLQYNLKQQQLKRKQQSKQSYSKLLQQKNRAASVFAAPHLYLSSVVTQATGCGSTGSPWLIQVGQGQRINLTLYDFSADSLSHYYRENTGFVSSNKSSYSSSSSSSSRTQSMTCRILATLNENTSRSNMLNICSGQGRVHTVYTSSTNQVQLRFLVPVQKSSNSHDSKATQPKALGSQFMFMIRVMGCANPPVQPGMRINRMPHHVVIDCGSDVGPRWEMTCINDIWIGSYSNCSQDMLSFSSKLEMMFPYATSVVVVAIIASIMVCLILTAGILCIKWRLKQDMVRTHYQTKPSGSRDMVYDFSAVNSHSLPVNEDRKYRALPADGPPYYPGGCLENLNEYATMRLLQQESERGFRNGSQGNIFGPSTHSSSYPSTHPLPTMVVMAPSTSVTHGNLSFPSSVTTFLSSEPHDAYRSDHIYESPDLVKAEVDKLNMVDKNNTQAITSVSTQHFPSNRSMPYIVANPSNLINSPKISQHHNANLQIGNDNRNFLKFQAVSAFEGARSNQSEVDDVTKRSNRDAVLKL